jgi:hypothetical protein
VQMTKAKSWHKSDVLALFKGVCGGSSLLRKEDLSYSSSKYPWKLDILWRFFFVNSEANTELPVFSRRVSISERSFQSFKMNILLHEEGKSLNKALLCNLLLFQRKDLFFMNRNTLQNKMFHHKTSFILSKTSFIELKRVQQLA